jgi:hypothetical protein
VWKSHWPWFVFVALLLVFVVLRYITPDDGTRQKLTGVFVLTWFFGGFIVRGFMARQAR